MGAGLNGIIIDDIEWPITRFSRSRYTYKLNISKQCILGTKLLKNTITRVPSTSHITTICAWHVCERLVQGRCPAFAVARNQNVRPVDCKSSALTTTLPSHTICVIFQCPSEQFDAHLATPARLPCRLGNYCNISTFALAAVCRHHVQWSRPPSRRCNPYLPPNF